MNLTIKISVGIIVFIVVLYLGVKIILRPDPSQDSITLYIQKIPETDLKLVEYDVWYGFDGNSSGLTILKSTDNFNFRNITELPLSIVNTISKSQITGAATLSQEIYNTKEVLKNNSVTIENIKVNTNCYKRYPSTGPCMLNEYSFDSFKETSDTLYLYNLWKECGSSKLDSSKAVFNKGNIKIHSDPNGLVHYLEIQELLIIKEGKLLEDFSDFKQPEYLATACARTYYMKPESEMYESEFSDYGIFKELK